MTAWTPNKYALSGIIAVLALLACIIAAPFFISESNVSLPPGRTPTETATAAQEIVSVPVVNQDGITNEERVAATPTVAVKITFTPTPGMATIALATPTASPVPTAMLTPIPSGPHPLDLLDSGVVRDEAGGQYTWFAIVENPNADWSFEDAIVRVVDTSGESETEVAMLVLGTLYAVERAGFGGPLNRQTAIDPSDFVVRLESGRAVQSTASAPVIARRVTWQPDDVGGRVSALVHNQSDMDYLDIGVLGLVRDESGTPVAVHSQLMSYVPSQSETGAVVAFPTTTGGANAELYVARMSSTRSAPPQPPPLVDVAAQTVIDGESDNDLWAAVFESRHDAGAVAGGEVLLTFLDATDVVIAVQTVDVPSIRPRSRAAVVVPLPAIDGEASPMRVIAHVRFGAVIEDSQSEVAVEDTLYLDDQDTPRVEGVLRSAINRELENLPIIGIAFDAEGAIAGAGVATVPVLPANGWSFAQVRLTLNSSANGIERAEMFVLWTDETGAAISESRMRGRLSSASGRPNGLGTPGTNDSAAI